MLFTTYHARSDTVKWSVAKLEIRVIDTELLFELVENFPENFSTRL